MQRLNTLLAGLLVVQGALLAVTWLTGHGSEAPPGAEPLITGSIEDVTVITVEGQPEAPAEGAAPKTPVEAPTVTLTRQGDGWVISSAGDYPAKTEKVEEMLGKLMDLQIRRPIATQAANHPLLKVADDDFSKKVTLTVGGAQQIVYVGPGASNTVHLRRAGDANVYRSNGLSEWGLGATPRTYLNTTYVSVESDDLQGIDVKNAKGAFTLQREGGEWRLQGAPEGQPLDSGKINSLVSAVSKVYMTTPVGKEEKPEYGLGRGAEITLRYTEEGAERALRYRVGVEKGDTAYMYVKADDRDYVILASKYAVESALLRGASDLLAKVKSPPAP